MPFSSEVLLAGMLAIGYNAWLSLLVATFGNTLGGMTSYGLGYMGKWAWLEKYFRIKQGKIGTFKLKVERYGVWAALLTWLPIIGDLISISLGFLKISASKVALLMLVGRGVRYLLVFLLMRALV